MLYTQGRKSITIKNEGRIYNDVTAEFGVIGVLFISCIEVGLNILYVWLEYLIN